MSEKRITSTRILKAGLAGLLVMFALGCGASFNQSPTGNSAGSSLANQPVSSPQIGYVWDPTIAGVRPVVGVSEAASLGKALYAGLYTSASISQWKSYALLTSKEGEIYLATLPNGVPQKIGNSLSGHQQIALSPSGREAIVFAPDAESLIWIQGLPKTPSLSSVPVHTSVSAATLSDNGMALLVSTHPDGTSRVESMTPGGSTATVATLNRVGGLVFLPHSTSALITDAVGNRVLLASSANGAFTLAQIAGAAEGIAQPGPVAASSDARWAVVTSLSDSQVTRVDLTHQAPVAQMLCDCSPTVLVPLQGNSTFLLTPVSAGSILLYNGAAAKPRIFHVSGIRPSGNQGIMQ